MSILHLIFDFPIKFSFALTKVDIKRIDANTANTIMMVYSLIITILVLTI